MPLQKETTAEHVVGCIDALVSFGRPASAASAAPFADISDSQAEAALDLGVELRLISKAGTDYSVDSPLCRFLATANQNIKAAILRIALESYEPFLVFRQRFLASSDLAVASRQTKAQLVLGASRGEVLNTLISLGSFSQALFPIGGGHYEMNAPLQADVFASVAGEAVDQAGATQRIRVQIGPAACGAIDDAAVLVPLSNALTRAKNRDGRGAVLEAGNALESYITALSQTASVNLGNATGLGAKLDKFSAPVQLLPKKMLAVGKYLSNIRNAADHGVDADIGKAWEITESTGLEYVFVACTFIRNSYAQISTQEGSI